MTALAVVADVEAVIGRTITDSGEIARVTRLLDMASGLFRAATGQTISAVSADTIDILDIPVDADLWLPERPVTAITAVTLNGQVLDPTAYRWYPTGLIRRTGWVSWGGAYTWPTLQVTYDHGQATVDAAIAIRVAELVKGTIANPSNLKAESDSVDGGYVHSVTYGDVRMLLADDDPVVRLYRPPISSVPIQTGVPTGVSTPLGGNW